MDKLKQYNLPGLLKLFFILYGLSLASFINIDNSRIFSLFDTFITVIVLLLLFSKLMMRKVRAEFHLFSQIMMWLGACLILLNTAYRHSQIIDLPSGNLIIMTFAIALISLAMQMPYYTKALKASIPKLIQSGKIDVDRFVWNIYKKTEYDASSLERGLEKWMRRLGFFSPLAFGLGMITSRNLDYTGHVIFNLGWTLIMFFLLIIGQSLPLAELWLIRYLKRTMNLDLYVE